METRQLAIAALLAMVLLLQPVHGQLVSATVPVGLGFSRENVQPVDAGIPVYVVGDQLWFESYTSGPVDLIVTPPVNTGPVPVLSMVGVPGNVSLLVLTFSSQDPSGLWSLTVSNSTGAETIVGFYLLGGYSSLTFNGYGVNQGGILSLNYTLDDPSAYRISTCTAGNVSASTASVPIPLSAGGGTMLLTLNGTSVSAFPEKNIAPFQFWLELRQDYSTEGSNQTFLTTTETVAETQPAAVAPGSDGAFTTALKEDLPLATGQFSLLANFELKSGVVVEATEVLVTGTGSWIWLQDCSATSNPVSTRFTVQSSLNAPPSQWPRFVYVLYTEMGVSLFSVAQLDIQPSTIHIVASPWGEPLSDSAVQVSGTTRYSVGNGTVYLLSEQYPLQVTVSVQGSQSQRVTIDKPYSIGKVQVPAAQVVVQTSYGGQPVSGVPVTLNDSDGVVATKVSSSGQAVFYVPPGTFTVSGVYEGQTRASGITTGAASGSHGETQTVTIQFVRPATGGDETYPLLVGLTVGLAMSGIVWSLVYIRRRRTKGPTRAGAEKGQGHPSAGVLS